MYLVFSMKSIVFELTILLNITLNNVNGNQSYAININMATMLKFQTQQLIDHYLQNSVDSSWLGRVLCKHLDFLAYKTI